VAIIQARMGSTRLPGKVLMDLAGEPMLARVVRRVQRARTLHAVMVATTVEPADDPVVDLCAAHGWPCARGSQDDVLERYHLAAQAAAADIVVRITADCPLIEPTVIDRVVEEFLAGQPGIDYACNWLPARTFPRGLDTEVFSFVALDRARREDHNPAWREHVTPFIYRQPTRFHIHGVTNAVDLSDLRWTVDTQEDLTFARRIYDWFGDDAFGWQEVLAVLKQHPEWLEINRHIEQKAV
jgi:spore coat polysaccharide biosynthesis protein SpsF